MHPSAFKWSLFLRVHCTKFGQFKKYVKITAKNDVELTAKFSFHQKLTNFFSSSPIWATQTWETKLYMRVLPLTRKRIFYVVRFCFFVFFFFLFQIIEFSFRLKRNKNYTNFNHLIAYGLSTKFSNDNKSNWSVHLEIRHQTNSLQMNWAWVFLAHCKSYLLFFFEWAVNYCSALIHLTVPPTQ